MIPIGTDIPIRSFPAVTVGLIALNVTASGYGLALGLDPGVGDVPVSGRHFAAFLLEFGLVPCRIGDRCPPELGTLLAGAPPPWLTVLTSMFLHGGVLHLGGNMLCLWLFGRNLEDALGRLRFVGFYLLCGVVAAASHCLRHPTAAVPMVGASGAVSGTLGGYLLLYPHARISMRVVPWLSARVVTVPALVVLGVWVLVQLASSLLAGGNRAGEVAVMAHVGGLVTGLAAVRFFHPEPTSPYR